MFYAHLSGVTGRILSWLLFASVAFVTAISLAYSALATAASDDYCRAGRPGGWAEAVATVIDNYQTWSGRWAVHGFYSLTFPYIPITSFAYNVLVALSLVVWFAIFYIALHILFRGAMKAGEKALLAILLCAAYWAGMPGPSETWYWLTGSIEYQLPFLLMMLSLLAATSAWATAGGVFVRIAAFVLAAVPAFVLTGLNELVGLFLLGILVIGVTLALLRKRPAMVALLAATALVTIIGLGVNLLAPGTGVRTGLDFENARDFVYALRLTLFEPGQSPLQWLSDSRLIWLSLLLLTSPWFVSKPPSWTQWTLPRWLPPIWVVLPLIVLAAVLLGHFSVTFAQGQGAPLRVLNLDYAVLMIGWLVCIVLLSALAAPSLREPTPLLRGLNIVAAIMLPLSLVFSPNVMTGLADLKMTAADWRPAIEARNAYLHERAAAGDQEIVIAPIPLQPRLFFWAELSENPRDWRNACVARDYGVRDIRVGAPE